MNNDVRNIIEDSGHRYFMKPNDRLKLAELRAEYYKLTDDYSHFVETNEKIVGPNVAISGMIEEVAIPNDSTRYFELFEELAGVLKRYHIETDTYRRLGTVFEEMGREPSEDTKQAIEFASRVRTGRRYGDLEQVCWEFAKKHSYYKK